MPAPVSLISTGTPTCLDDGPQCGFAAERAAVTLGLDHLLEEVQVHRQGVRLDHVDRLARLLRAQRRAAGLRHELRRADVRDQVGVRRRPPRHRVCLGQRRSHQRRSLTAQSHGQPVSRRAPRQHLVDCLRHLVSAGHRRDQQWRREPPLQETRPTGRRRRGRYPAAPRAPGGCPPTPLPRACSRPHSP